MSVEVYSGRFRNRLTELYLVFCSERGLDPKRGVSQFLLALQSSDEVDAGQELSGEGLRKVLRGERHTVERETINALIGGLFNEGLFGSEMTRDWWREELHVARGLVLFCQQLAVINPDSALLPEVLLPDAEQRIREAYASGQHFWGFDNAAVGALLSALVELAWRQPSADKGRLDWEDIETRLMRWHQRRRRYASIETDDPRYRVANEAVRHLGVPYAKSGATPQGFDQAGFIHYVYRHAVSFPMPQTLEEQREMGTRISPQQLQPGDLVVVNHAQVGNYFRCDIGIYLGDQLVIQGPVYYGDRVAVDVLKKVDLPMPQHWMYLGGLRVTARALVL